MVLTSCFEEGRKSKINRRQTHTAPDADITSDVKRSKKFKAMRKPCAWLHPEIALGP
jgi:hypothetical protein